MSNIYDNVQRILRHYGLDKDVSITRTEPDRVFGWSCHSRILEFVIAHNWNPDDRVIAGAAHGTQYSFREPGGVRPALQICFHPYIDKYFLEFDLDYASPAGGFWSFLTHAKEVVLNFLTRTKTDQEKIARLLDKRGIAA